MAVKTNQTWTLYNTNGCQDESNMNSLQNKWRAWRIKHELSTKQMAVALTAICFVEFMFDSSWQHESNMNSLQNKWQSTRIKHELSTQQMAVKTIQTWTLYKKNGSQDESNMNSLQKKWLSREFMFDSSGQPFVL
jgi:DNA-binding XRE family transcriptional regulator